MHGVLFLAATSETLKQCAFFAGLILLIGGVIEISRKFHTAKWPMRLWLLCKDIFLSFAVLFFPYAADAMQEAEAARKDAKIAKLEGLIDRSSNPWPVSSDGETIFVAELSKLPRGAFAIWQGSGGDAAEYAAKLRALLNQAGHFGRPWNPAYGTACPWKASGRGLRVWAPGPQTLQAATLIAAFTKAGFPVHVDQIRDSSNIYFGGLDLGIYVGNDRE